MLDLAFEAARAGATAAAEHSGSLAPERKADGTWVTAADRAGEAAVREVIAADRPRDSVLGEEAGLSRAAGGDAVPDAPMWIVDPIDGTDNFIAGMPVWGTLVALRHRARNLVGVAHAPALGETYAAAAGLGATCNGSAIEVDPVDSLSEATVCFTTLESWTELGLQGLLSELAVGGAFSRSFGSFWGHALVARGAAHVMVEREVSIWDVAALDVIVTEAGGRITRLDGGYAGMGGSCLSTCRSLHDEVLALAARYGWGPEGSAGGEA